MAKERITAGPALAAPTPIRVEDAGADDRADAERDQMRPAEASVEPVLRRHILVGDDRLAREQVHEAPLPLSAGS